MKTVDRYAYGYALLVLVGVVVLGCGYLFSDQLLEVGDIAANSLQIREAAAGRAMVGPYSRYRFNHPGPISFYYLAFAEHLLPGVPTFLGRYNIAQLILNCGLLALLLRMVGRTWEDVADPPLLGLALLFTLLPIAIIDFHPLWEIWGPLIIILPMTLFVFCAARLAAGRMEIAPLAALVAALAVHNHTSAASVVVPLGMAGVISGLGRLVISKSNRITRRTWIWLAAAVGVLVVTSLPSIIEQLTAEDGNLGRLYGLFSQSHTTRHGLIDTIQVVWWAVAFPVFAAFQGLFGGVGGIDPMNPVFQSTVALLLGVATWRQWRRGNEATRMLIATVVLAIVLVVAWARTVRGDLEGQLWLFHFVSGLAGFLYFWVLRELLAWARQQFPVVRRTAGQFAVVAFAAVGGLLLIGQYSPAEPGPIPDYDQLIAHVDLPKDQPVHLFLDHATEDHDLWPDMVIVGLKLERLGYDIRVSDKWLPMFGPNRCEQRARHAPNLVFSWRETEHVFGEPFTTDRFQVYLARDREWSESEIRLALASDGLEPLVFGETYACDDSRVGYIGWYAKNPHKNFRWSMEQQCSLLFRLDPEIENCREISLTLRAGALGMQRIGVSINDHPLDGLTLEGFEAVDVPLVIPTELLEPGGVNQLRFDLPDANRPDPGAKRVLAMRLEDITLNGRME